MRSRGSEEAKAPGRDVVWRGGGEDASNRAKRGSARANRWAGRGQKGGRKGTDEARPLNRVGAHQHLERLPCYEIHNAVARGEAGKVMGGGKQAAYMPRRGTAISHGPWVGGEEDGKKDEQPRLRNGETRRESRLETAWSKFKYRWSQLKPNLLRRAVECLM